MNTINDGEFAFRLLFKKETGIQYIALPDVIEYLKQVRAGMTTPEYRELLSDIITNLATIRIEKQQ